MRIASLAVFILGSFLMMAQDNATKIKKVAVSQTSAASGKEMFNAYCASCHGLNGKGNGPAAAATKTQPTDLTLLAQKNGGKFPSMDVINSIQDGIQTAHGSKDMPVWGPLLSSVSNQSQSVVMQRLTNLTAYIDSLQTK